MKRAKKETAPTAPLARTGRDIGPNTDCPALAIEVAAALIARHGVSAAIRALDIAIREAQPQASADIADAVRLAQMRRRAT